MKSPLQRVLGIRTLLEDMARLDFETRNAQLLLLGKATTEQRRVALQARAEAFRGLEPREGESEKHWLVTLADAAILRGKENRLAALARAAAVASTEAGEALAARRIERRQLEAVVASAAHVAEKKRLRRDQDRTDDWFQGRRSRRHNRK